MKKAKSKVLKLETGVKATTKRLFPLYRVFRLMCMSQQTEALTAKKLRKILRYKGSMPLIPRRQFPNSPVRRTPKPYIYKSRWQIEKAFSQTDQFRKLIVRQERDSNIYKQYWYL